MIEPGSTLWQYLSETQRQLVTDGVALIEDRRRHPNEALSDYSYLVFPFAKLYEGFLKQLFRDLGIIHERDYESTHFRLGKVLSPNLVRRLRGRSAYGTVTARFGAVLAEHLWSTWKQGRNLVFHYFPHNVRRLSFLEAQDIILMIVETMSEAVKVMKPVKREHIRQVAVASYSAI
mgnify:FL=1